MKTKIALNKYSSSLFVLVAFYILSSGNCLAQNNRLWATYIGAANDDYSASITTDRWGNVYVAGKTNSTSGIASGGFQNIYGGGASDAFLAKYSPSGSRLWATYYGGNGDDSGYGVTVDKFGNVFLTGYTNSSSGIASGGFQNTFGGGSSCGGLSCGDAFLVKFDSLGNRLWATYYGDIGEEYGLSVTNDTQGNVYIGGQTTSTSGIASGGFQNIFGGGFYEAFLVKFNAAGNRIWATYYGGAGDDYGKSIATDLFGNVYLGGFTKSSSGIASGGFQNVIAGSNSDAFLTKFDSVGNRLWATYYGGIGSEQGYCVTTDISGNIYLTGETNSTSSISSSGFQNNIGGAWDAFLVKFNSAGSRLWASYYGGSGDESGNSVITDTLGNVYLAGQTYSASNIASNGFQNTFTQWSECFIAKFNSSGNRLCATYYGGPPGGHYYDKEGYVAIDISGNVYLTGSTESTLNITSGGFQNTFGGGAYDSFLTKLTTCCNSAPIATIDGDSAICNGQTVTLNASGGGTYLWNTNDTNQTIAVSPTNTTSYSVIAFNGCGSDTVFYAITVNPTPIASISGNTNICSGQSTTLIASGGGTFTWNTNDTTNFITISPSSNIAYSVIVSDGTCSDTAVTNVTVSIPQIGNFSYVNTPYCKNGVDPLPTFNGNGIAGVFASTSGLIIDASTGQVNLSASSSGTYTVTNIISASGGCPSDTSIANITIVAPSSANFSYSNNNYCQDAINPLPIYLGGGIAGTFTSTPGLSIDSNTGEINLTSSVLGVYVVTNTIPASSPCPTVVDTATITITALPIATFNYTGSPYCQNGINPQPTSIAGGTAGIYNSTAGLNINANSGQIDLSGSTPGTYTVTNTIIASGGCPTITASTIITIRVPNANVGTDTTINIGSKTQLYATGGVTYSWLPLDGLSCANCQNPIATPFKTTTYTVTVIDTNGCSITKTVNIVVDEAEVFVPDIFSPNGDGQNDILYVRGAGIKEFNFTIYDQLGEKIFESNDITKGWDGTYKDAPLNNAVFAYYLAATLYDNKKIKTKGDITLIR